MRTLKLLAGGILLIVILSFSLACTATVQDASSGDQLETNSPNASDPAQADPDSTQADAQGDAPDDAQDLNIINEFNKPATDSSSYNKIPEGENIPPVPTPAAVSMVVNEVLVEDDICKIVIVNKAVDKYGDAGFTLLVDNRLPRLTAAGTVNYIYLQPLQFTWTVNGEAMDPKVSGNVYRGSPSKLYLYFDELDSIEQLHDVKGTLQVFDAQNWWDPVSVYEFSF